MKAFLKLGAILFHPLFIPIISSAVYFFITPRFVDPEWTMTHLQAIGLYTIVIPILFYFLLKHARLIESIYLRTVRERRYPLMIQSILFILIIRLVLHPYDNPELYFFFVALLFSNLAALIMSFFSVKVSLHQMGIAAVLFFSLGLSAHFKMPMIYLISFLLFANGWVASARLSVKAHNNSELLLGFLFGSFPQIVLYNVWL